MKKQNYLLRKLKIMRGYFGLGQLSATEKQDILNQHKSLYNGYQTMQPQVSNTQPLTVYDFAGDKEGMVVNNKGEVKRYTNVGINEQVEQKEVCDECGSMMMEGECTECGWKGDMEEGTGKLDDIYDVKDLGDNDFDYVEGGGNDYGTFEKMHHMKNIKSEQEFEDPDNEDDGFEDIQAGEELDEVGSHELVKGKKYKFKSPSFEDEIEFSDEYDDKHGGEKMYQFRGDLANHLMASKGIENFVSDIDEQGYTGGGNAPDMDISNIEPAYDFVSNGPTEVYPEGEMDEEDDCLDCVKEYETMESAWADDELDEANDISGSQGIYGDMEPPYDFDSKGPGSAGPYQRSSWTEEEMGEQRRSKYDDDFEEDELEIDFDEFDPRDKSWDEIKAHTGDWDEIDEDLQESFISQKNKVMEMMNRMKVIK